MSFYIISTLLPIILHKCTLVLSSVVLCGTKERCFILYYVLCQVYIAESCWTAISSYRLVIKLGLLSLECFSLQHEEQVNVCTLSLACLHTVWLKKVESLVYPCSSI